MAENSTADKLVEEKALEGEGRLGRGYNNKILDVKSQSLLFNAIVFVLKSATITITDNNNTIKKQKQLKSETYNRQWGGVTQTDRQLVRWTDGQINEQIE